MRVICINSRSNIPGGWCELMEGMVYDAEPCKSHCGIDGYVLSGDLLPTQCSCGHLHSSPIYRQNKFIPLSTIDETELVNESSLLNQ